ncbi:glycosyltransferase [Salinibacterium sp. G-O1]|uniref:glycosyltransferase n=1 Tax=Salinibacterium sp. G-O1 TaxID=3046208 RepID=UPI0024B9071D|nr:glycosyltransferase [Salinibacterium sp. G-O1]MDJ0334634.1 glycosyltransferase [Salinibacterium sp. G-O1]
MVAGIQHVAMISMHTSPVAQAGTGDAGGLNIAVLGVAAELAIREVQVDLITRAEGEPGTRQLLPGVTLHEVAAGPPGVLPKGRLPEVTDEFGEGVARLARSVSRPWDLMHAHYWLSGIAVLPVSLELQLPLVQSFHTIGAMKNALAAPGAAQEPEQRVRSEMFIANQADAIIAASSAEATALIDLAGAPANRTWIVPPGVDLGLFSPRPDAAREAIRTALGLEGDRPLVVIVGRVQPLKGHELAVRAVAELRAMRGWAPILAVAGEVTPGDEAFVEQLMLLASELGVASDVRFVGAVHRDALADLLSAAAVTIMPSFSETFGLVALESAAAGTPVIAYRTGGLAESVSDGVSGLLLGTRDPRYWASEIAILIEDHERREAMALTARAHAERFTWATAAASLLGIYSEVAR